MLFHPVIHNFRYKASVEHGNEYHIKRKLCIMGWGGGGGGWGVGCGGVGGGETESYKQKV